MIVDCECTGDAIVEGCTDEAACNYNPDANTDDGSCAELDCEGVCGGDAVAGSACGEDGTYNADCMCIEEEVVFGCTDEAACNYNADAEEDDGSCILNGDTCDDMNDGTINDTIVDCECTGDTIVEGCTDEAACNYNPDANTDDGSCAELDCEGVCGGDAVVGSACGEDGTYNADCECIEVIDFGCTNPDACNYDENADEDDGSCILNGDTCDDMNDGTINDTIVDCECTGDAIVEGCTDEAACNYNPDANTDDGSCAELDCEGVCGGDAVAGSPCDGGIYNTDCECIPDAVVFGCTDETACNYDPEAEEDNGSCFFNGETCDDGNDGTINDMIIDCECTGDAIVEGCTNTAACNYNPEANVDDGSCADFDCEGICGGDAVEGAACGENGTYDADCECIEDPVFDCPDQMANIGDACDDGNGVIIDDCTCFVDDVPDCPDLMANIGDACDDGDDATINDEIQENCECVGEPDEPTPAMGDIEGVVWEDTNGNGVQDPDEPGLGGIEVILVDESGAAIGLETTEEDGSYSFEDVEVGDYTVEVGDDVDVTTAASYDVTVEEGVTATGGGFGVEAEEIEITCETLEDIDISTDISCDENTGIYTLTVSVSGGMPAYAMDNPDDVNPEDFFYTISGVINAQATLGEDFTVELPDNSAYSIDVEDSQGCTASLSETPPSCTKTAVEFMGLNGRVETAGNYLYWATASEENNDYFEVQRSINGMDFETLGKVNAVGNSHVLSVYDFNDLEAPAGEAFYRIASVDNDGKMDFTNVISLNRGQDHFGITHINPVPTSDQLTVSFNVNIAGTANVTIVDVTGKVLQSIEVETTQGLNQLNLNVGQYSAGVYFLNVTDGVHTSVDRFVVE